MQSKSSLNKTQTYDRIRWFVILLALCAHPKTKPWMMFYSMIHPTKKIAQMIKELSTLNSFEDQLTSLLNQSRVYSRKYEFRQR